jgi:hypothetical protein
MEQVKIFHDRTGNILTVWFGNPQEEYVCEETGDEVILMKDRTGRVIGFEKLNFSGSTSDQLQISYEELVDSRRHKTHTHPSRLLSGLKSCPYERSHQPTLRRFTLDRFKGNGVPKTLQATYHMRYRALATPPIEVLATEIVRLHFVLQNVIRRHQDRMTHRDDRPILPTSRCQSTILGRQLSPLVSSRRPGRLRQRAPEPFVALGRLATAALARTLVIAWTHPCLPRHMIGIGQLRPIWTQLRQ